MVAAGERGLLVIISDVRIGGVLNLIASDVGDI